MKPDDLLADLGGLGPQVRIAGDGDADAGGGQLVGEGLGVGRVRYDGGDVGEQIGAGDFAAEFIAQCPGQAGGEVRGPVRIKIRAVPGRRGY